MRRLKLGITALLVVSVVAMTAKSVSASVVYDAVAQFDPVNNPSGPWSYGGRATANSTAFTAFTSHYTHPGNPTDYDVWINPPYGNQVGVNMTNAQITYGYVNNVVVPAHTMTMHSGAPLGELGSVLRWTAPASGLYSIQATFAGSDTTGTTTDVHVVYNGSSLYSDYISGYGDPSMKSFSGFQNVNAGDKIDIFVGDGGNGQIYDTTRVALTITSTVPEPTTLIVWLLLGGLGISVAEWRRRKRAA